MNENTVNTRPEDVHPDLEIQSPFLVKVEYAGMPFEITGEDTRVDPDKPMVFTHTVTTPPSLFVRRDDDVVNAAVAAAQRLFIRARENQQVLEELDRIKAERLSTPALDHDSPEVVEARKVVRQRREDALRAHQGDQAKPETKPETKNAKSVKEDSKEDSKEDARDSKLADKKSEKTAKTDSAATEKQ